MDILGNQVHAMVQRLLTDNDAIFQVVVAVLALRY